MRRWTEAEFDYLRSMAGLKSTAEIAKTLDRSRSAVQDKCQILGIRLGPRRWTRKEEARLICLKGTMPYAKIGQIMGRSMEAIRRRIFELGLAEGYARWDEKDSKRLIRLNRFGWSDCDIAIAMDRDRFTIIRHRKALGVPAARAKDGNRTSERTRRKIAVANRRWHRAKRAENRP